MGGHQLAVQTQSPDEELMLQVQLARKPVQMGTDSDAIYTPFVWTIPQDPGILF